MWLKAVDASLVPIWKTFGVACHPLHEVVVGCRKIAVHCHRCYDLNLCNIVTSVRKKRGHHASKQRLWQAQSDTRDATLCIRITQFITLTSTARFLFRILANLCYVNGQKQLMFCLGISILRPQDTTFWRYAVHITSIIIILYRTFSSYGIV